LDIYEVKPFLSKEYSYSYYSISVHETQWRGRF